MVARTCWRTSFLSSFMYERDKGGGCDEAHIPFFRGFYRMTLALALPYNACLVLFEYSVLAGICVSFLSSVFAFSGVASVSVSWFSRGVIILDLSRLLLFNVITPVSAGFGRRFLCDGAFLDGTLSLSAFLKRRASFLWASLLAMSRRIDTILINLEKDSGAGEVSRTVQGAQQALRKILQGFNEIQHGIAKTDELRTTICNRIDRLEQRQGTLHNKMDETATITTTALHKIERKMNELGQRQSATKRTLRELLEIMHQGKRQRSPFPGMIGQKKEDACSESWKI